jgi:MSHA pilin protein MshA
MQIKFQKQQGFTLIELVVVIIILGILAVTAAPKFMNLQSDARVSALQGVKGAIQSANTLVYSKAALAGLEQSTTVTDVTIATDETVSTLYGYMDSTADNFSTAIEISVESVDADITTGNVASTDSEDWVLYSDDSTVKFWQNGAPASCFFEYTPASAASSVPDYGTTPGTDDC